VPNGLMFGPDGKLYACQNGRKRIVAYDMDGKETVVAEGLESNDLTITQRGEIYVPIHRTNRFGSLMPSMRNAWSILDRPPKWCPPHTRSKASYWWRTARGRWCTRSRSARWIAGEQAALTFICTWQMRATQSGADGMTVDSQDFSTWPVRLACRCAIKREGSTPSYPSRNRASLSNAVLAGLLLTSST
jgi:hypothetical protein